MTTILTIPKLEMSMTEGTLAQWVAADGAQVSEGEVIYILETDKTARDIESPASGTLSHAATEGETYECGTKIGSIA